MVDGAGSEQAGFDFHPVLKLARIRFAGGLCEVCDQRQLGLSLATRAWPAWNDAKKLHSNLLHGKVSRHKLATQQHVCLRVLGFVVFGLCLCAAYAAAPGQVDVQRFGTRPQANPMDLVGCTPRHTRALGAELAPHNSPKQSRHININLDPKVLNAMSTLLIPLASSRLAMRVWEGCVKNSFLIQFSNKVVSPW
eukprot:5918804-Amphidinium_carterae.2